MKLPDQLIAEIEADLDHIQTVIAADTSSAWKLTAAAELERIAKHIREATDH